MGVPLSIGCVRMRNRDVAELFELVPAGSRWTSGHERAVGGGAPGQLGRAGAEAGPIRFEVFVEEQKVPAEMELDEFDALSCHALALADGQPVGTGRLLPTATSGGWRCWRAGAAGRRRGPAAGLIDEAGRRGMAQLAERPDPCAGVLRPFRLCAGGRCMKRPGCRIR
jgi:hypothetical protein